jgi:RimJ/RimL family protein N-acetyltransferase
MLKGDLVQLRGVELGDYPRLAVWLNDPEVMKYWGRPGNTVAEWEVAADEQRQASRGNSRKYVIETLERQIIGQIDYYDLDWQARSAWVSVLLGEREYWGGGYGTDAMRTLLRFLFEQLGLHRVSLTLHDTNVRALHSYEKNGFVKEGMLREWAFFNGSWVDGILMGVLDRDFRDRAR